MSRRNPVVILLVISFIGGVFLWRFGSRTNELFDQIRLAARQNQFAKVIELSQPLQLDVSRSVELRALRGRAFRGLGQFDDALKEFSLISDDGSIEAIQARWETSEILLQHEHRPSAAVDELKRLLVQDAHHAPARVQLAALLAMSGRNWEATELRLELIRDGVGTARELVLLGLDDLSVENLDRLREFRDKAPNDFITRMAEAYSALRQLDFENAERLYRQLTIEFPDQSEAQARLGALLIQRDARKPFLQWHEQLPATVESHPDLWEVRGDFARLEHDTIGAVRCYWEAVKRNPAHRRALHRLGLLLQEQNEPVVADLFLQKAARLLEVQVAAKRFHVLPVRERALESAESCARAGLEWEAWGWSQVGRELLEPGQSYQRPDGKQPRMNPSTDPANVCDLSRRSLPPWVFDRSPRKDIPTGENDEHPDSRKLIAFEEASSEHGFQFSYYSGDDPDTPEHLPFQFTGGGVAILDYDRDHWPDIFLTQGNDFPNTNTTVHRGDVLFRNQMGQKLVDIAQLAGIDDGGYGQGATVGDFDSDGFQDLYIANLEGGRLYRNSGDGTFRDITVESRINAHQWTTSCLLADLNNDGHPDLYLVNYLEGKNLYQTICRTPDGRPRGCTPYDFKPAQDALWLSSGDGEFFDVTKASGIEQPGGNGLGIVAIRDEQSSLLNLFVSNDTTANFWFVNRSQPKQNPVLEELALSSGLAFDRDGRAQACMGIAAGDADGDGRIDLFVTNFYDESNTLYLQHAEGLFDDATAHSGLRGPSLKMLGFGTQFLDADLDGWLDLIVTNGHVDPIQNGPIPSRMRPQFFRNRGRAQFQFMPPESVGAWFATEHRGRGLARLDWNCDGKEDFVVSHLDSTSSLMVNASQNTGNSIKFVLVGTKSPRDAVGTTVRLFLKDRVLMRQLTSGDGYQACNEQSLVFGLADATEIDRVEVRWPSGDTHSFRAVTSGSVVMLIEGRDKIVLNGHRQ